MGVDYTPHLIAGNSFTGNLDWYLVIDDSMLELKELAEIPPLVGQVERDLKRRKIKHGPFKIHAQLSVC